MTRYEKALKAMHYAENKHPKSFVAVNPDSGRILAHNRKLSKVSSAVSSMPSEKDIIISKKLPECYYGYFNLSV